MEIRDELEYVRDDLKGISESDTVEFHNVRLMIIPMWATHRMRMDYYFDVTIHDLYEDETDSFVTRRVTINYWGVYDINLVELLNSDNEATKLKSIFGCPVMIEYANYDIPHDKDLSLKLEERLQSTWDAIYCAINDL